CVHADGAPAELDQLSASLREVGSVVEREVRVEGHEQFPIRGIAAGAFVVQEHQATAHHFDVRLEVDGSMRSWAVPKGPSMDPTVKRLAVEVEAHTLAHNDFEGPAGDGGVIIWDRGEYEQGGRVPWPEALQRGHAVFVLHGQKLRGGFALQRTRDGDKPQWLLIKGRDEEARARRELVAVGRLGRGQTSSQNGASRSSAGRRSTRWWGRAGSPHRRRVCAPGGPR